MVDSLARLSIGLSLVLAVAVGADITLGRRQSMAIMNLVWPITMLYAGPLGLAAYLAWGRAGTAHRARKPWVDAIVSTLHCGAGCTLGDIVAECVAVIVPFALFGQVLLGTWTIAFVLAFAFGIGFQYAAIAGMRRRPAAEILRAAVKADALSLTAWQVGMYGAMAAAIFIVAARSLDARDAVFWLAMQGAMLTGFCTSLPVNIWLLRKGWKTAM